MDLTANAVNASGGWHTSAMSSGKQTLYPMPVEAKPG